MSGNIGTQIVGAVEIVVGALITIYSWGTLGYLGVGLMISGTATIVGDVISTSMQPKANTPEAAKAKDIQFANAAEGFPVPVVFGEGKVVPNWGNFRAEQFYSTGITKSAGGKGGAGSSQVVGFNYYLTFEQLLCCGPVDGVGQVISVPGDLRVRENVYTTVNQAIADGLIDASQSGTTVTASDPIFTADMEGATLVYADGTSAVIVTYTSTTSVEVDTPLTIILQAFQLFGTPPVLSFTDDDPLEFNLASATEGGLVRLYRGSLTQTRISDLADPYADTGMNYRDTCWALHSNFLINQNTPTPRTYQYIIRRLPKCIRDGETLPIVGLITNGSADPLHANYKQANPAAIIYEAMTNKVWGDGMPTSEFNEASFIARSQFFQDKNIGLGMVVTSPEQLGQFLDGIKAHCECFVVRDNGLWTLVCTMDPSETLAEILTLTDDECDDVEITRPLWPSTVNQLQCEYNSEAKLYKPDTVQVQDLANLQIVGRINPAQATLVGFCDVDTATRHAWRQMRKLSYPAASGTLRMNRFKSRLAVGCCFRFQWKEWADDITTSYFDVVKLEPDAQTDTVKVTVVENAFICAVVGKEDSVAMPSAQTWEKVAAVPDSDISLFLPLISPSKAILPVAAIQVPALYSAGLTTSVWVFGQLPVGAIDMQVLGGVPTQVGVTGHGAITSFNLQPLAGKGLAAQCGKLSAAFPAGPSIDRSPQAFEFILNHPSTDEKVLLGVNQIATSNDDISTLADSKEDYMLIDQEIIQIGLITKLGTNHYGASNIIRGCFSTPIQSHANTADVFYVKQLNSGLSIAGLSPIASISFKALPVTTTGVVGVGDLFMLPTNPTSSDGGKGGGGGSQSPYPPAPEPYSITSDGTNLTIKVRPRYADRGSAVLPFYGTYDPVADTDGGAIRYLNPSLAQSFQVAQYDASDVHFITVTPTPTYTAESISDELGGLVTLVVPIVVNTPASKGIPGATYTTSCVRVFSSQNNSISLQSAMFAKP